jgi:hypothetical protein
VAQSRGVRTPRVARDARRSAPAPALRKPPEKAKRASRWGDEWDALGEGGCNRRSGLCDVLSLLCRTACARRRGVTPCSGRRRRRRRSEIRT